MEDQTFDDVFDALAKTPAQAANMKARADLLSLLVDRVKSWDMTQEAAASKLGITRPRLNDLLRGKLGKFSLDALVNLAGAAGFETTNSIGLAQWLLSTAEHSRRLGMGISALKLDSDAIDVEMTDLALRLILADGRELSAPLEWFPRLRDATPEQRGHWRLIGGGQGIHWPDIDEEIAVATLLRSN